MNVESYVMNHPERKRDYEYYKSLGYGEKASQVLASLIYGDHQLAKFLKNFDREGRLDKLWAWLLERPEESPREAINNEIRSREFVRVDGASGGPLHNFLGGVFAPKNGKGMAMASAGGPRALSRMAAPDMECELVEEALPVMGAAAPAELRGGMPMPAPMPMPGMPVPPIMPAPGTVDHRATDSYEQIEEKDATSVLTSPTSTFRMTTTTASMGILLNQIRSGRSIDLSQVRIEEVLNYFDYDHGAWTEKDAKFRISTEQFKKSEGKELLYVNVEAADQAKERQNVMLLLDVSGSMSSQNHVTQEAIATIVGKLHEGDVLTLVTYSSQDETVFANHVIAGTGDKEDIMGRILEIQITGCTNGSAGIETAYSLGKKTYKEDWSNQVILITDGDLNFGITKKDGLKELIEEKKKTGLFLSVIGTGLYNYKDDKLEVLSKHGNGTYCVVNDLEDVERCVNRRFVSLTNVIAKDVKAQVEFNPKFVKKYRLLGYENRTLAHEDFVNDKVISEPYGSGGHGVALYELELGDATASQELKYQQAVAIPSEELCTVKVRFKEPLSETSAEISKAVMAGASEGNGSGDAGSADGSRNVKLAYFLYCLSEKLRKSDKLDDADKAYFQKMLESGEYKELAGDGGSEVELLIKKMR